MIDDPKPNHFALPDSHPAKPLEEVLHLAAPHLAAGVYDWLHRPPRPRRPPLTSRLTLAFADRLSRAGRALHAFVSAYAADPAPATCASMPSAKGRAENGVPSSLRNGITSPTAAEGSPS
jgi:hypothetical protein